MPTTVSSSSPGLASVTGSPPSASQIIPLAFPNDSAYLEAPASAVSTSVSFNFNNSELYGTSCWYPVSGNYGRLPRILYYITIVFALVARTHPWLIAGALAAAFTYSGSAAIHAALMVWRGPSYGDLDIVPILGILSTACLISVPLLNWSHTLRDLGKQRGPDGKPVKNDGNSPTRTVIIYWGFLVTIGFLCIFVAVWDPNVSAFTLSESDLSSTFSCSPPSGQMNMTVGQVESWGTFLATTEWVEANNCNTPCTKPWPAGGIFRSDRDLTTINADRMNYMWEASQRHGQAILVSIVKFYIDIGLCLLPFILLQGMFAASFGRRAPSDVRDLIFLESYQRRLAFAKSGGGRGQRALAKTGAIAAYLWALFMVILCPPLFVVNLIAVELFINNLPESEDHTHIGAWSPYASTGLVLFAVFVARYHDDLVRFAFHGLREFGWRAGHIWRHSTRCLARLAGRRRRDPDQESIQPDQYPRLPSEAPYPFVVGKSSVNALLQVKDVIDRYLARVRDWYQGAVDELQEFVRFCRDPEETALHNTDKALRRGGGVDIIRRARGVKRSQPYHDIAQPLSAKRFGESSHDYGHYGRAESKPPMSQRLESGHHLYDVAAVPPSRYTSSIVATPGNTHPRASPTMSISSSPRASSAVLPGRPSTRTKPPSSAPSSSPSDDQPPLPALPIPVIHHQPPDAGLNLHESISATISTRQRRSNLYTPNAYLNEPSQHRLLPHPSPDVSPMGSPYSASDWPLPTHSGVSSLPPPPDSVHPPSAHSASSLAPATADDDYDNNDNLSAFASPAFNMARFSSSPAHVRELLRAQREQDGVARMVSPRLSAVRSTVSYLQVQRPETMMFGDEIRLRKDEWGVYHVVEE